MKRAPRVVVAMSGGVDSSVAALLLVREGYEVIGVTMQLWPWVPPEEEGRRGGCCSLSAVEDARRVAFRLGIPHYVLNFRELFDRTVVEYFAREYARGRTPNPCIACNRYIKFQALLGRARELEAEFLATGHYARRAYDPKTGRYLLLRGRDRRKDQSYVLYCVTQEQLSRLLFPLGELTKREVRRLAREEGLPVAEKEESQEICFVEGEYPEVVAARHPEALRPGPIVDREGRVLGLHRGIARYTRGQRRGLGVASPRPLYVVDIRPEERKLVVGPEEEARAREIRVGDLNLVALERLDAPRPAQVQVRYRSPARPALLFPEDGTVRVEFEEPEWAPAPGQAAVFYEDELVLGGGVIEAVGPHPAPAYAGKKTAVRGKPVARSARLAKRDFVTGQEPRRDGPSKSREKPRFAMNLSREARLRVATAPACMEEALCGESSRG